MHQNLKLHPDSRCEALTRVEVEIARTGVANIVVRFIAHGKIHELVRPPLRPPRRADELWRSTCFEIFFRTMLEGGYCECNLSPSTEWAAYGFMDYRAGMHHLAIGAPMLSITSNDAEFALHVEMNLGDVPDLANDSVWRLGLSAVIEEINGCKSYWALRHPPGKPDFHHPDCFALELPPP